MAAQAVEFVLVNPSHPGNVGAAARAIGTMGFSRLCVVAPRHAQVAQHPEAIAFASGATGILASLRVVDDLDAALAHTRWSVGFTAQGREFAAPVLSPRAMAEGLVSALRAIPADALDEAGTEPDSSDQSAGAAPASVEGLCSGGSGGPVADRQNRVDVSPAHAAIVFGTERTGLSIEQAQRCRYLCSIDTDARYTSLNLAQAVQLAAFVLREALLDAPTATGNEVALQAGLPGDPAASGVDPFERLATHQQLEGLFEHMQRMLETIGFLDPQRPKRLMPRMRRLLRRAAPTATEVDILRGIFARILEGWPKR